MILRKHSWRTALQILLLQTFIIYIVFNYLNSQSQLHRGSLDEPDTIKVFPSIKFLPTNKDSNVQRTPRIKSSWQELLCSRRDISLVSKENLHILPLMHRDVEPNITTDNIFCIESSCNPSPNYRSWCSLESWAKHHPEKDVWYIMTSPYARDSLGMMGIITKHYKNVRVVEGNLDETFKDVPLKNLFRSHKWIKESAYPANKLSNYLRLVLLYKYGGIYSDTDVIAIRRVPRDVVDAVAFQGEEYGIGLPILYHFFGRTSVINNAVILSQSKNQVLWRLMQDIPKTFQGYTWGSDGPTAMTRAMKKACNGKDLSNLAEVGTTCGNITILPSSSFYPIPYQSHDLYTKENNEAVDIHKKFKSSYGLHFWNALTKKTPIQFGGNSLLDLAAKFSCPLTYEAASSMSTFF